MTSPNSPVTPIIVQNASTNVRLKIYQGDTFEIELTKPERINVFAVAELIEAGERVKRFKLESVNEDGSTELLYEGTSIGFYRAVQFKSGYYKCLRFTVTDTLAQPMLLNFGLHYFEDHYEKAETKLGNNIVKSIESSDNGKCAVANFGGIYPFNYIELNLAPDSAYKVYAFNGSSYEMLTEGISNSEIVKIHLKDVIEGSYQIKIEADTNVNNIYASNI